MTTKRIVSIFILLCLLAGALTLAISGDEIWFPSVTLPVTTAEPDDTLEPPEDTSEPDDTLEPPEETDPSRGDMNGDGAVNSNDAIYLLRHTLQPNTYRLHQDGNVDGKGNVDSNDAIYLLRHTLQPNQYPLH